MPFRNRPSLGYLWMGFTMVHPFLETWKKTQVGDTVTINSGAYKGEPVGDCKNGLVHVSSIQSNIQNYHKLYTSIHYLLIYIYNYNYIFTIYLVDLLVLHLDSLTPKYLRFATGSERRRDQWKEPLDSSFGGSSYLYDYYTYLRPKWTWFWSFDPQNGGLTIQKIGHLDSRYRYGGFLEWGYPKTMGFNTQMV